MALLADATLDHLQQQRTMVYSGLREIVFGVVLMSFRMVGTPLLAADVAELVQASAGHMVAPFVPLNYHLASTTLPVVQIVLEVIQFKLLAVTLMLY